MGKKNRRRPTEAERAERREAERLLMAEAIEQLRSSEGWRRWLSVRRHFHRYSLHNQFLIARQMPEARKVAGFAAWKKIGYAVRKGEHRILIWAPCRPSKKRIREWKDAGADPDAEPRTFFRMVGVFDRSEVVPLADFPGGPFDLDSPGEPIAGSGLAHLFGVLCEFGEGLGSSIRVEDGRGYGSLDRRSGEIRVNPVTAQFSANAQVAVLIHELCHRLLQVERREDDPVLSYGEEEVVVECAAYTVCGAAGLDTSGSAVPYMTGWSRSGGEVELFAGLIDRLARRLEDVILAAVRPEPAEAEMALTAA
jgi:hypothetical protein